MSLTIEAKLCILEFRIVLAVPYLENLLVPACEVCAPSEIGLLLVLAVVWVEIWVFLRRVLTELFCTLISAFFISLSLVAVFLKVAPFVFLCILLCFLKIRIIFKVLVEMLPLLFWLKIESRLSLPAIWLPVRVVELLWWWLSLLLWLIVFVLGAVRITTTLWLLLLLMRGSVLSGFVGRVCSVKIRVFIPLVFLFILILFLLFFSKIAKVWIELIKIIFRLKIPIKAVTFLLFLGLMTVALSRLVALSGVRRREWWTVTSNFRSVVLPSLVSVANNLPSRRNLLKLFGIFITGFIRVVFVSQGVICLLDLLHIGIVFNT